MLFTCYRSFAHIDIIVAYKQPIDNQSGIQSTNKNIRVDLLVPWYNDIKSKSISEIVLARSQWFRVKVGNWNTPMRRRLQAGFIFSHGVPWEWWTEYFCEHAFLCLVRKLLTWTVIPFRRRMSWEHNMWMGKANVGHPVLCFNTKCCKDQSSKMPIKLDTEMHSKS